MANVGSSIDSFSFIKTTFESIWPPVCFWSSVTGKGRNVGGATRSASVLRSKSAGKNRSANKNVEKQIESSPPERLEVSTTPATLEDVPAEELESSGRSVRRGKPIIRPRPGGEVAIEGSLIHLDDPTTTSTPVKQTSTERLKANRRQPDGEVRGTGSIVSSFPLMHSHVAVSSRVDVRIGGLSKVRIKSWDSHLNFFFCAPSLSFRFWTSYVIEAVRNAFCFRYIKF